MLCTINKKEIYIERGHRFLPSSYLGSYPLSRQLGQASCTRDTAGRKSMKKQSYRATVTVIAEILSGVPSTVKWRKKQWAFHSLILIIRNYLYSYIYTVEPPP